MTRIAELVIVCLSVWTCHAQLCHRLSSDPCRCKMADDVIDLSPLAKDVRDWLLRRTDVSAKTTYTCGGSNMDLCESMTACLDSGLEGLKTEADAYVSLGPAGVELLHRVSPHSSMTRVRLTCVPPATSSPRELGVQSPFQQVEGRLSQASCDLLFRVWSSSTPNTTWPPYPTLPSPGVVTATALAPTGVLLLLSTEVILTALILVTITGAAVCALSMRRMKQGHFRRERMFQAECQAGIPPAYVVYEKLSQNP